MFSLELFLSFLFLLILLVMVLISVAFLTLMERKILGYIQIRKGPNKVGYLGVLQPFSDAIKLFNKEQTFPIVSNYLIYYYSPVFMIFISLFIWSISPYLLGMQLFNLGFLFLLCCMSVGVYGLMLAGWSSNSLYSMLGSLRSVAQTISYEVSLSLILLSYILMVGSFNFFDFFKYQYYIYFLFLCLPLSMIYFVTCLAETNRTPFDFAEGESELVSGFNVEYSSGGFAIIFMAEYSSILFMSMIYCVLFLGCNMMSVFFYIFLVVISFIFIWVRGTLPRYRYDKLMYLCWKCFLPISLNFLLYFIGFKIFILLV